MPSSSSSSSDGGSSSSDTENDKPAFPYKCSGDVGMFSRPIAVTDDSYFLYSMYNLCKLPSSIRGRCFEKENIKDEKICGLPELGPVVGNEPTSPIAGREGLQGYT